MRKTYLKRISILLAVVMVGNLLPVNALARTPAPPDKAAAQEEASHEEPYVLYEVTGKRGENVKHFLMSDGNYMAAQYDIPVHYQDASGTWREYDNTLEENRDKTELRNKKSDKDIRFSKKAGQNRMIRLCAETAPISWGYEKIRNSPAEIIPNGA